VKALLFTVVYLSFAGGDCDNGRIY